MKSFWACLCVLLLLSLDAAAESWLGQKWLDSVFMIPSDQNHNELVSSNKVAKVYKCTHVAKEGWIMVAVNNDTGRISGVVMDSQFNDVFSAVAFASILCDGEASLPDKAVKGQFKLVLSPSDDLAKQGISLTLSPGMGGKFSLEASIKELSK